jgi:hypothetical protein
MDSYGNEHHHRFPYKVYEFRFMELQEALAHMLVEFHIA